MIKQMVCTFLLAFAVACSSEKKIDGVLVPPTGLWEGKKQCIEYRIDGGNVFWIIVGASGFIIPAYIFLFDLWEPIGTSIECAEYE